MSCFHRAIKNVERFLRRFVCVAVFLTAVCGNATGAAEPSAIDRSALERAVLEAGKVVIVVNDVRLANQLVAAAGSKDVKIADKDSPAEDSDQIDLRSFIKVFKESGRALKQWVVKESFNL
ncbi:MAG: hypothetical protein PHS41_08945, partial [Victivallaceae bacterium]|nr:hypothetical protein [Victivallaceae bacterium]